MEKNNLNQKNTLDDLQAASNILPSLSEPDAEVLKLWCGKKLSTCQPTTPKQYSTTPTPPPFI